MYWLMANSIYLDNCHVVAVNGESVPRVASNVDHSKTVTMERCGQCFGYRKLASYAPFAFLYGDDRQWRCWASRIPTAAVYKRGVRQPRTTELSIKSS